MDGWLVARQAVDRIGERVQRFILDLDEVERLAGGQLVAGHDERDRIADESDAVEGQGVLVLADRQNAIRNRQVAPGEDQMNTGHRPRARRIDRLDARMGDWRAEQTRVQHPRQHDIVGEARLPGDLCPRVDAPADLADDVHDRSTAASTASTIC